MSRDGRQLFFGSGSFKLGQLRQLLIIFVAILVPVSALAQEGSLTRRDAFLLMWEAIKRPAFEVREEPYADVGQNDAGYKEITYAKNRGILQDTATFDPNGPLTLHDAILWLMRTRNVAELPDMQEDDIPEMLAKYPIVHAEADLTQTVGSIQEITALMMDLDQLLDEEVHLVSFYADDFHGAGTAFGETFDMHALTAAHRSYPHNTMVRVTNLENEKSVIVRINDRGPYVHGRDLDLSKAAFLTISEESRGVISAKVERLGDQQLLDESPEESNSCANIPRKYQRRITRDVRFHRGVPHTWTINQKLTLGSTKPFVIRSITYPDGYKARTELWIYRDSEIFEFTPDRLGEYVLYISTGFGNSREFRMKVAECTQ